MTRASLVPLVLLLSSCAVLAGRAEYRVYRKIRLADSVEDQARLVHRYERDYPHGVLRGRVASLRLTLDEQMYRAARDEYGLKAYMRSFPDGAHTPEVAARLDQARRVHEAREQARRAQEEADTASARQEEQQRRRWFRGAFLGWVQILSRVTGWNTPLEAFLSANHEFAAVWREDGVAPVCQPTTVDAAAPVPQVCTREYPHDYFIRRTAQTRIDRQASFLLRVHTDAGKVVRIDVLIKGQGFLAWRELESQNDIVPDDPEQVADAKERAKTALSEMIATAFPGGAPAEVPADAAGRVLWAYAKEALRVELLASAPDAPDPPGDGLSFAFVPPAPVSAPPPHPGRPAGPPHGGGH
jgi:hypothetical protein